MSWSNANVTQKEWINILNIVNLKSYKNLSTGYSFSHKKIKNLKLIYKNDQGILSCAIVKYYKIYNLAIINIDGGIEGLVNKTVISSLILFFKKKYKFFFVKIDQQEIKYDDLFYSLGFRDLSKKKKI